MDNPMEKRVSNGNANFNNMTDEQLQQWHLAFLTEAQRENYVNHNLEIVRHYRTEAIARAPAFDIERNAISAAIARHGLWMQPQSERNSSCSAIAQQEEGQPPPQRRARIESTVEQQQQQQQEQPQQLPCEVDPTAANYGHYVALAHIFSNTNRNSTANNNNERDDANLSEIALTETIDSLGLRRT